MPDNPFSNYTPDDQNDIADQLRSALSTGKLNPAQIQGVQNTLKFLPQSKAASADQVDRTIGYGSLRPAPQQKFSDVMYTDPQSKLFGGAVTSPDKKYIAPQGPLVNVKNVPAARQELQTQLGMRAKTLAGDEAGDSTGGALMEGLGNIPALTGELGGTIASLPFKKGSDAESVARAGGKFFGGMAGDPMTYALAGAGGRALGVGFTAMAAKGAYESAGQLGEVWDREDIPRDRKIELGTNMVLNTLMGGVAGLHTVKSFLDTIPNTRIPVEDKAEIQQKIESEWQQMPNGQMRRRVAQPAVTANTVVNRATQGGNLSQQFPEGSFYNRQISKKGQIPVSPKPEASAPDGSSIADDLATKQSAAEGFHAPDDARPPSKLEEMAIMGGTISHAVLEPKAPKTTVDVDAAAKTLKPDTNYTDAAKAEWTKTNPDKPLDYSWLMRRAQELKSGKADPTLKPSADKTPVPEQVPAVAGGSTELTPAERAERIVKETYGTTTSLPSKFSQAEYNAGKSNTWLFKDGTASRGANFETGHYQMAETGLERKAASNEDVRGTFGRLTGAIRTGIAGAPRSMPDLPDSTHISVFSKPTSAQLNKLAGSTKHFEWELNHNNKTVAGRGDFTTLSKAVDNVYGVDLTPREKANLLKPDRSGVTDLRSTDPDTRHEWINMKSFMEIGGAKDAADAMVKARQIFGPDKKFTINSYLDKDGNLHHGIQSLLDESGTKIAEHPQPGEASPHLTEAAEGSFRNIQDKEGKFNELTGGKHSEILNSLWDTVKKTLPDSPHEAKLGLYEKSLDSLLRSARDAKSVSDFQKAFDIAGKKSEGGFAAPFGKQRLSPADAEKLARAHADITISRWEKLPDSALTGKAATKKLTDPALRNSVLNSNDPKIQARYDALLDRNNKLRASDPIAVLGHTLDGHDITPGDVTKGAMREGLGTAAKDRAMREKQLQSYRDSWRNRPIKDTINFIDAIEHGDINSIPDPTDRAMAGKLRDLLDNKRDEIHDLGREMMKNRITEYNDQIPRAKSIEQENMWTAERNILQKKYSAGESTLFEKFNENYFPHLWRYGMKDMVADFMQGRRPFGPQGFLKKRTYSTFSEGLLNGMEPVTYNPVDMALLKLHEMDRFATAHSTFNDLKSRGLAHIYTPEQVPPGWTKVQDGIFNAGEHASWYMPKDAAQPINRYLSPGLRGNVAYDAISQYNNLINQFNLGLSAFHGIETGVNAAVSKAGLGLVKLTRGDLSGLKDIATSPAAPITSFLKGRKVAAEYLDPGRFSQYNATAEAVAQAGGRVRMPAEFTNQATEAWRSAWKEAAYAAGNGAPGRALSKGALGTVRSIGALMEQLNKPIMEWYVPNVKLGVFHDMAKDVLDRLPANASPELMRKELGYAWDRVDDRFGQVVYDNLFWNRMAKDVSHIAIRSVGWNYGDVRELGGAVWDLRDKTSLKAAATGKGITQKQGYVLGLLGYTAMLGYTLNHFYGQKIDNPTDLLYPKTGQLNSDGSPQRIYLKTYVHDAYGFTHAPGETALNKAAPIWHEIGEMYKNADFYGTQIHPIHATTGDALTDPDTYTQTGKYLLDQAAPFSARNFMQRKAQGESTLSALSSSAAILPAPKWVGQSKAELLAFELFKTKMGQGPNDQLRTESVRKYHELASGYAANKYSSADITAAFKSGQITAKQFDGILAEDDGKLSPLQRHVKQLEPHEFLRVWDAADKGEKILLRDDFLKRWDSIDEKYPSKIADPLQKRFQQEWKTFSDSK